MITYLYAYCAGRTEVRNDENNTYQHFTKMQCADVALGLVTAALAFLGHQYNVISPEAFYLTLSISGGYVLWTLASMMVLNTRLDKHAIPIAIAFKVVYLSAIALGIYGLTTDWSSTLSHGLLGVGAGLLFPSLLFGAYYIALERYKKKHAPAEDVAV